MCVCAPFGIGKKMKMNTFSQQGCNKLIISDFYIVTNDFDTLKNLSPETLVVLFPFMVRTEI